MTSEVEPIEVRQFWGYNSWSDLLLQVQTFTEPSCSVELTEVRTTWDSAVVSLTAACPSPDFTAFMDAGSGPTAVRCDQDGNNGYMFICNMTELQPGTLYELRVISGKDEERSLGSMRTGKNLFGIGFSIYDPVPFNFSASWSTLRLKPSHQFEFIVNDRTWTYLNQIQCILLLI